MNILSLFTFAATLALIAATGLAATPQTINYQGYVTNAAGTPVNNPVVMTFRLYSAATGGSPLYSETQLSVNVVNGSFNALIGDTTPIGLPFDQPYWLSVAINSDGEMSPRQPLASSPYAFRASQTDALSAVCSGCVSNAALSAGIDGTKITFGSVAAADTAATANAIQGRAIANIVPLQGQALEWNNAAARWEPQNVMTSVTAGSGLSGGTITSTGTIALATTIPADHTLQGNITVGLAPPATLLAKLSVPDSIGNTSAIFGTTRPVSMVNADASVGFNAYYNGAWKVASGGFGTGYLAVDTAGNFQFHTGNAPATGGTAITETEKIRINNAGRVDFDRANLNDGRLDAASVNGAGVSFGQNSGEGIASRRIQGTGAPEDINGLDFYTLFTLHMTLKNNGTLELDRAGTNAGQLSGVNPTGAGLTFGHNSGEGIASKRTGAGGGIGGLDFYTASTRRMFIDNAGAIYRTNNNASFDTTSDERLKDIHGHYLRGLKELLAIEPITFHYKRDNPLAIEHELQHIGVSAQALQRVIPEAVRTGEMGYLNISIDPLIWTMVNAIKEQDAKLVWQHARLQELEEKSARLETLERELAAIKTALGMR